MCPDQPDSELMKAGVDVAVEAVKLAYDDALKPLAVEVGKALGTVGKTVNMALAPLRGLVWSWEKIEGYVLQNAERILNERGVPGESIGTPDPDIAVPALEALRYSKLRENYVKLLATAMDTTTSAQAHPAFVEVLKQLSPDEARILEYLPRVGLHEPLVDLAYELPERGRFIFRRHVGTLGQDAGCRRPQQTPEYLDNLYRLGLLEIPESAHLFDDWRYDKIGNLDSVKNARVDIPQGGQFAIVKKMVGVTSFGEAFRKACVTEPRRKDA
jgi:hypothetical protein